VAFFQRGAQHGRQVADFLGDEEVMFHETFDAGQTAATRIAQPLCDRALHVEAQDFLGTAGQKMHVAAHEPEKFFTPQKTPVLARREQSCIDKLGRLAHPVDIFGDPEQ
jgi:hypothetical protein